MVWNKISHRIQFSLRTVRIYTAYWFQTPCLRILLNCRPSINHFASYSSVDCGLQNQGEGMAWASLFIRPLNLKAGHSSPQCWKTFHNKDPSLQSVPDQSHKLWPPLKAPKQFPIFPILYNVLASSQVVSGVGIS